MAHERQLFLIATIVSVYGAPTYNSRDLDVDEYLQKYGYFTNRTAVEPFDARKQALRLYQGYYGLKKTGFVDESTFSLMTMPRCGVPDNPDQLTYNEDDNSLIKPLSYKLSGPKWDHKNLRWRISKETRQLSSQAQRKNLEDALKRWERVSGLTFIYDTQSTDIDIQFVTRDHGDGSAFDGRSSSQKGNVLAHAFPPGSQSLSGDAHFDNDERWTVDINNKQFEIKYLEKVAAHEFGHSLGIHHSKAEGALMNAYYSGAKTSFDLNYDDINAIQKLYGKPDGWFPTLGGWAPTPKPAVPSCYSLFEAVVWGSDHKAWGILSEQAYSINDDNQDPVPLQDVFPGAPVDVDFAFSMDKMMHRGAVFTRTYMFMGPSVWRFTDYQLDSDYPKPFSIDGLPEPPVTAIALNEGSKNRIFMIGTTKWWAWEDKPQFNNFQGFDFEGTFQHKLSDFPLVTSWVDGDLYLIKHDSHVRLRNRRTVEGYPKEGVPDWIYTSCPSSSSFTGLSVSWIFVLALNIFVHIR